MSLAAYIGRTSGRSSHLPHLPGGSSTSSGGTLAHAHRLSWQNSPVSTIGLHNSRLQYQLALETPTPTSRPSLGYVVHCIRIEGILAR